MVTLNQASFLCVAKIYVATHFYLRENLERSKFSQFLERNSKHYYIYLKRDYRESYIHVMLPAGLIARAKKSLIIPCPADKRKLITICADAGRRNVLLSKR